jgi:hypothetical protein
LSSHQAPEPSPHDWQDVVSALVTVAAHRTNQWVDGRMAFVVSEATGTQHMKVVDLVAEREVVRLDAASYAAHATDDFYPNALSDRQSDGVWYVDRGANQTTPFFLMLPRVQANDTTVGEAEEARHRAFLLDQEATS